MNEGELEELLVGWCNDNGVAGAAVAVVGPHDALIAAAGTAHAPSGTPATVETSFRLGSVAKVLTSSMVMAAVARGALSLDARIADLIPGFTTLDPALSAQITVGHAISKSEGLWDHVEGFGSAPSAVSDYVASLARVGHCFRPGEMYGYSNTGAIIAARVLEVLHDRPYDQILEAELLKPLAMADTVHVTDSRDLHDRPRAAHTRSGRVLASRHMPDGAGGFVVGGPASPPALSEPMAMAACGTTLVTTIGDLATFVGMHLLHAGGGPLPGLAIEAMRALVVETRSIDFGSTYGWECRPSQPALLRHGGGSRPPGTFAQIALRPEAGTGFAVLANGPGGHVIAQHLTERFLGLAPTPSAGAPPAAAACAGTYVRGHATFVVRADGDDLLIDIAPGPLGDQDLKHGASGRYVSAEVGPWFFGPTGAVAFLFDGSGEVTHLHDGRAASRTAPIDATWGART